jgi:hypothetical protein
MKQAFRMPAIVVAVVLLASVPPDSPAHAGGLAPEGSKDGGRSTPFNIHLTWDNQDGADTTVVVAWATADSGSTAVQYGFTDSYGLEALGASCYSRACDEYINEVRLSDLNPDTVYHYRCGSPSNWSADFTFRTGLPKGSTESFTFIAYGDSRTNLSQAQTVADAAWANDPDFVLHAGDFVATGEYQSDWNQWFAAVDDLVGNRIHMGTIGNHDLRIGGAGLRNYKDQFALPHNEEYYSFDYGNAHFVCVYLPEDASQIPDTSAQYQWLVNDLAAADADPDITWKFAWWHVPPYAASSSHWAHNTTVIGQIFPLFEQYHVQVVFQGHCHDYERTYMLKQDQVEQYGPLFADPQGGVISVITGGAGAPLTTSGSEWWTAYSEGCYHFCRVTVDDNWLTLDAVYDDGTAVFDSFTIMLDGVFDDLRAFWRFEEGGGNAAADQSGYANEGAVSGANWTPLGPTGGALEFDGVDDYVAVPNSPSLINPGEQLSLLAWVKPVLEAADTQTVVAKWYYDDSVAVPIDDRSFLLQVTPAGEIRFALSGDGSADSSTVVTSSGTIGSGVWTHVAATCDGDTMRVYIGGACDSQTANFSSRIHPSGADLHIGRLRARDIGGQTWHDPFAGLIDELRIYARALTVQEIQDDAAAWATWARLEAGDLQLHWDSLQIADSVFVFREPNAYFTPDMTGYANRVAAVSVSASPFNSPYGVGDPSVNAFYRLVAYDDEFGGVRYSPTLGEFDF